MHWGFLAVVFLVSVAVGAVAASVRAARVPPDDPTDGTN